MKGKMISLVLAVLFGNATELPKPGTLPNNLHVHILPL